MKNNIISNCPVTSDNILSADDIFGPDVGALRGKNNISKTFTVHSWVDNIPAQIIERYKNVILSADIMKVN